MTEDAAVGDPTIPLEEVAVDEATSAETFCGLCRPAAVPVVWDPEYGYLCPRHGDGSQHT